MNHHRMHVMNNADLNHLVSKLRTKIFPRHRNVKNYLGPQGRLNKLVNTVTAVIKYERLELNYNRAHEAQGYVERLISEAIRHGDTHQPTMDMACYWLIEKQLVSKLFKVLAPRFKDYTISYSVLYKAPDRFPDIVYNRSVFELRGNPFPPLIFDGSRNRNLIHNILLDEARREYRKERYSKIAEKVASSENQKKQTDSADQEEKSKAVQEITEGEELLKFEEAKDFDENSKSDNDNLNANEPVPVV